MLRLICCSTCRMLVYQKLKKEKTLHFDFYFYSNDRLFVLLLFCYVVNVLQKNIQ